VETPRTPSHLWHLSNRLILWLIDPLLSNDSKQQLFGQRLGKHVPLLDSRFLIMQQLDYNNGNVVFSMRSVPKRYKHGTKTRTQQWLRWRKPVVASAHGKPVLSWEGAPNQQTRNCQTIIKIWS
jgi:hypothetical protein